MAVLFLPLQVNLTCDRHIKAHAQDRAGINLFLSFCMSVLYKSEDCTRRRTQSSEARLVQYSLIMSGNNYSYVPIYDFSVGHFSFIRGLHSSGNTLFLRGASTHISSQFVPWRISRERKRNLLSDKKGFHLLQRKIFFCWPRIRGILCLLAHSNEILELCQSIFGVRIPNRQTFVIDR
jgi:hypothetical protein